MTKKATGWDRHAIKAEVGRQGLTLVAIAKRAGLEASAVRHGLRGGNRRGAQAIAEALQIPFRVLFPDSYLNGLANEREDTRSPASAASQNEHVRDDQQRRAS